MAAVSVRVMLCSCLALVAACSSDTKDAKPAATATELRRNMQTQIDAGNYQGALVVANTLAKRFPDSQEAAEVAAQLPDIRAGADRQRAEAAQTRAEREQAAAKEQVASNQIAEQRFEQCRDKLKKANELELLYDLTWNPPAPPRVLVGPTFFTIPIDAKEGFVETVNCFLVAGAADKTINFDVLHWQTGRPVGKFSYGRFSMN